MRSRRLLLVAGALVLLGMAVTAGLLLAVGQSYPPVAQENCERIKKGMSRADVEAICGGPPGDYRLNRPDTATFKTYSIQLPEGTTDWPEWSWDDGDLRVFFDAAGRVLEARLYVWRREGVFDRLRRLVGR
jgi:hypothetical protein